MVCEEKPQVPEERQETPAEKPQEAPSEEPQQAPTETEESQYSFGEGVRWAVWLLPQLISPRIYNNSQVR